SANRSGRPSPTRLKDAVEETGAFVAASVDGGDCQMGLESTVVSLMGEARYLRAGLITRADIEAVIGKRADEASDGHRSPGRLTRHSASDAPVKVNATEAPADCVYIAFGATDFNGPVV